MKFKRIKRFILPNINNHFIIKDNINKLVSFCYQLKMVAADGKNRMADCLNTKGILRLVQSILGVRFCIITQVMVAIDITAFANKRQAFLLSSITFFLFLLFFNSSA